MFKNFLNSFFGFNRQQRNGLWVLIFISFILLILRIAYPRFIQPQSIQVLNLPLVERRLDSAYRSERTFHKTEQVQKKRPELFAFDPNTASEDQLLLLGFKPKTAAILIKFRNGGFKFREKKDLRRVYGVSDLFYDRVEPYILIQNPRINQEGLNKAVARDAIKTAPRAVELNSADSARLIALKGIGVTFARRILKYRDLLGGYADPRQLMEVYGFSEPLYTLVQSEITVDPALIKKIDLNADGFKTINRHPYISYALTRDIFNLRRGTRVDKMNLKDLVHNDALYEKLLPYLTFD